MIDRFLAGEDWDEAHPDMGLEEPYGKILDTACDLVERLSSAAGIAGHEGEARSLLFRAPAIVNIPLNYKICAEHGLPFHPTVYYELAEAKRYDFPHPIDEIEKANRLFRASIELARAAVALKPGFVDMARSFSQSLPGEISSFIYTSSPDKYTWRACEPRKIARLAASIRAQGKPDVLVAAAHGSIMPALILAEYLELPLYFVRFSMFKRHDEAPILSLADEAWLSRWEGGYGLIFDEDVAGGRTLALFSEKLRPLFAKSRTACVIRHAGASIRPDFVAQLWYD